MSGSASRSTASSRPVPRWSWRRPAGELVADRVVVCAGLQADRVARLAGDEAGPAIVAFRGEYWRLIPDRAHLVGA